MQKSKSLQFQDQSFFIGSDVHANNWKITIRNNGMHLKQFSMNSSPRELYNYMHKNYPGGTYFSVYEAGFCGYWIHRELTNLGFHNIIVNPSDVPTKHKEKDQRRDKIDSNKLSRELNNGSLEGIYIPTKEQEALRCFSRLWYQLTKRNTQIKNRIKAFLYYHGIELPRNCEILHWTGRFIAYLNSIHFENEMNNIVLKEHLKEFEHIRLKRLHYLTKMREYGRQQPIIKLLRTVPGIGIITSFVLYAELLDINRFPNEDCLASFVGLVPSVESSNDKDTIKGITARHCRYLRYLLVEASWQAVRVDPALTNTFNQHIRRMKKNRAIIRIAKKLLKRIRSVWINKKAYVLSTVQ